MKNYLWMSSAAVVIGTLRVENFILKFYIEIFDLNLKGFLNLGPVVFTKNLQSYLNTY